MGHWGTPATINLEEDEILLIDTTNNVNQIWLEQDLFDNQNGVVYGVDGFG